jgi:hypothetical protein
MRIFLPYPVFRIKVSLAKFETEVFKYPKIYFELIIQSAKIMNLFFIRFAKFLVTHKKNLFKQLTYPNF